MSAPTGYRENAMGHLVREADIPEVDLLRDQVVTGLVAKARGMAEELERFRRAALGEVQAFVDLSMERYGRFGELFPTKGKKPTGNVTLNSFDGKYRLTIATDAQLAFNEGLAAARDLIWACLARWTEGSRTELRQVVEAAFKAGRNGKISISKVLMLRQIKIEDVQWLAAMDALAEALQEVGTRTYLRVYVRTGRAEGKDTYALLPLDVFPRAEAADGKAVAS